VPVDPNFNAATVAVVVIVIELNVTSSVIATACAGLARFPPTVVPSPTNNFSVSVVQIGSPAAGMIVNLSASVPRLICNGIIFP
jgi:hypothetical protein